MGLIRLVAGVIKATAGACVSRGICAGSLASGFFKAPEAKRKLDKSKDKLVDAENNHAESGKVLVEAVNEHERTGKELEVAQHGVDEAQIEYEQALKTDKLRWGILSAIFNFIGNIIILIIKLIWFIIW